MQKMFRKYNAIADLLLPTELIPEKPAATATTSPEPGPEPELNFEEEYGRDRF